MKKALSLILVLVMLLGMMPMQVFATEGTQETEAVEVVTEPTEAPEEETTAPVEKPEVIHEHDYDAVVTDPTCTEQGYTTYTCECSDSYVDDYVDATGDHTYENGVCTGCGAVQPAPEWEVGTITYDNGLDRDSTTRLRTADHLKLSDYAAVRIGNGYELVRFVYDENHTMLSGTDWLGSGVGFSVEELRSQYPNGMYFRIAVRATNDRTLTINDLAASGITFYTSSELDGMHFHNYTAATTAPTCTEQGYTTYTCACGDSYVDDYVDATGDHIYENGVCTGCGAVQPAPEWEVGTIAYVNGLDRDSTTRLRTADHLKLSDYAAVRIGNGYELVRFVYDENHTMLGGTDWLGSGVGFSVEELRSQYPNGMYFRIAVRATNDRTLTINDLAASGITFYTSSEDVPEQEIGWNQKEVMKVTVNQDGAVYSGKVFCFNGSGTCTVYSLDDKSSLGSFTLDNISALNPHANSVCFSNTFHAPGDQYPLLYVNVYNNYSSAADRMEGTCCVYRLTEDDGQFTTELVQVVRIGFTEDLSLWKSKENNGDVRPYGNFVVDTDKDELYAFVMRDAENSTRFFRFRLPDLDAGVYSAAYGCNVVTLEIGDILSWFDTNYMTYMQGCCYGDGKILSVEGFSSGTLRIIDLETQREVRTEYLADRGLTCEPELICLDNGTLYYAGTDGTLRVLSLDGMHFHNYTAATTAPTCTEQGYTTYTCDCGDSYVDDYKAATGEHCYENGICTGCGQKAPVMLRSYRWEIQNNTMVSVTANGNTANRPTLNGGSLNGGVMTKACFTLSHAVNLYHDVPWVIEWRSSGNWDGMLFASNADTSIEGTTYLFRFASMNFLALGEHTDVWHNYGLIHGIDMTEAHQFRVENRVAADGTNTVYLLVDGVEIDALNHYYQGGTDKKQIADWANNRDLVFNSIGTTSHPMKNMQLEYLQVWENGHEHAYQSDVTSPTCTDKGYTTYTCGCGGRYVGSYVDAKGHSYLNSSCTVCGAAASNPYAGKTIACIGDSITYGVGVIQGKTDYVTLLAKALEMNYIRLGASGTTLCTDGARTCNIDKLTEGKLQGADVVTIAMGINDFCAAGKDYYKLGDINSTDSSTIYGAMRMWCERIAALQKIDSLKDTEFYFVTPLITSWNNSVTSARNWEQSKVNIHGYTLRDLCNAIIEVAALYDVAVIDLNLISGLYYVNAQDNNVDVFGGDGVHPGDAGHAMMAAALEDALLKHYLLDDHDHSYGSWLVTTYPDCESGEEKRVCQICRAAESRALAGKGHSYTESVTTEPTCVDKGIKTFICHCGNRYTEEIAAKGHTLTQVVAKVPTCTEVGHKAYEYCSDCEYTTFQEVAAKGHSHKSVVTAPTCTEQGYTTYTCACGDSYVDDYVDATGDHTYENGICTLCGKTNAPIVITQQPTNGKAKLGERYCVEVIAVGEGLQYQWYMKNAGSKSFSKSSVTDNTYDDVMTKARADREVYCVITDAHGNKVTTDTVKLICLPGEDLAITRQPNDSSAKLDETFCVTVEAKGDGLKYQWYWRNKGSENWNISGQKDNTYDDVMTSARHNREVYCVISDGWGNTLETEIATISGIPTATLAITRQPESQTVKLGENFNVTFDAVGDGLKYQWYFQNAGTETWHTSAQKDNSYDDVMTEARHNRKLYCVVTDAWGNKVQTEPIVTILATVKDELAITKQPNHDSAKLGEQFCVTVEAQGDSLKYQWYWRNVGNERWNTSGQRDNTYDDVMTKERNNREVKCVITDMWGNQVESDSAIITGIPEVALAITKQPTDSYVAMGERYCVTVEAQGDNLTYTWYFKNPGAKSWSKSGVKDNTYDDVMTKDREGREVYCVVTDALGNSITTDHAIIGVTK